MTEEIKVRSSRAVYRCPVFEVRQESLELPSGKVVERSIVAHNGSVVIIPQDRDGSLLMVRQYRASIRQSILEFPAGTLEVGEEPLACARREISEEVGFAAEEWVELGVQYPAPGLCNEKQYCYLARILTPHKLEGDEDEVIEVERLTVAQLEQEISSGRFVDGKSMAAFLMARLKGLL